MIQLHCARAINPLYKNPSLQSITRETDALCGSEATCRPFPSTLAAPQTPNRALHNWRVTLRRTEVQRQQKSRGNTQRKEHSTKKFARLFFFYMCVCARPQTHNRLPWSGLQAFAFVLLLSIVCLLLWTNYFFEWCCHLWINNRNAMWRMTVENFKSLKKYHQ